MKIEARQTAPLWLRLLFFPLSIFYMELILRLWGAGSIFHGNILYVLLFSLGFGTICTILVSILPSRVRRIVHPVLLLLMMLLFAVQISFFSIFRTYMELDALALAGGIVGGFFQDLIRAVTQSSLPILLLLFPLALSEATGLRKTKPLKGRQNIAAFAAVVTLHDLVVLFIFSTATGIHSPRDTYRYRFNFSQATERFGLFTAARLDVQYRLLGTPTGQIDDALGAMVTPPPIAPPTAPLPPDSQEDNEPCETMPPVPPPLVFNTLDIDFATLAAEATDETLAGMHQFFALRSPSVQNDMTGMFAGKNLIWILGEAFHTVSIHPEITPTLHQLANEGFMFHNFYNPDTGFSTTGGEFMTLMGMIPPHRTALESTQNLYLPFAFGNLFSAQGYSALAFHNHSHTFNGRNRSHPNLGYRWYAVGSGLDSADFSTTWPRSDLEMMELTVDKFIDDPLFHVYYLTISGHLEYNFGGNQIASQNRNLVEHLPYTQAGQAFLATQIELDRAIAYLLERLDAAGRLEDTVIVLSGDHYPYGLTQSQLEDLAGHPIAEPVFDFHHSSLIIWNNQMEEPIEVDTFLSSMDIAPTLLNLFGMPFDSRLFFGVDVFSDQEPVIPFASGAWISQQGRFNPHTRTFSPHPGQNPPPEYAEEVDTRILLYRHFSGLMLERDYFRLIME